MKMKIELESQEERELFERIQQHPSREQLMAEVTVLTELVRVLSDRVTELEKPVDNLDRMSKPNKRPLPSKWAGLTDEEKNNG